MEFMPKLAKYLEDNGEIYTVRKYKYHQGADLTEVEEVIYKRVYISEVTKVEDLQPYFKKSGFGSAEEWWSMIGQVNKRRYPKPNLPMYLFQLTKLKGG